MIDNHLVACLRLATSCYTPGYEKLDPSSSRSHCVCGQFNFFKTRDPPVLYLVHFCLVHIKVIAYQTYWCVYERV